MGLCSEYYSRRFLPRHPPSAEKYDDITLGPHSEYGLALRRERPARQANYSAAKAALIGAMKALAQEVAPRGITVNAIAPGFISTDMTKDLDEKELKKMIPAGRFGRPEEVAALAGFLVSEDAAYITGQTISVNGGLYT